MTVCLSQLKENFYKESTPHSSVFYLITFQLIFARYKIFEIFFIIVLH